MASGITLETTETDQDLFGTNDEDTLTANHTGARLFGGNGNDLLQTNFGGFTAADLAFFGEADDDRLIARPGVTEMARLFLDGGSGDDTIEAEPYFVFDGSTFAGTLENIVHGGYGDDVITASADLDEYDGTASNVIAGDSGADTIEVFASTSFYGFGSEAFNVVDGGSGHDLIRARVEGISNGGDEVANTITGGLGNDDIEAGAYVTSNASTQYVEQDLTGGAGSDRLVGWLEAGDDGSAEATLTIGGGSGHDTIEATSALGGDYFSFHEIVHALNGGSGRDTIASSITSTAAGSYLVIAAGGSGSDAMTSLIELTPEEGTGGEPVHNVLAGDLGADTILASITLAPGWSLDDSDLLNEIDGGQGSDVLEAQLILDLDGVEQWADSFEVGENVIHGGTGNDTLIGRVLIEGGEDSVSFAASSSLFGGAGQDTLTVIGGTGNLLDGGARNDVLLGGDGADRLIGGGGADRLTGGLGEDTFVFDVLEQTYRRDRVMDFESGVDTIELATAAFAALADLGTGVLDSGELGYGKNAETPDQHLFYDQTTGVLYYDADGSESTDKVQIAIFDDLATIEASDIYLV